MRLHVLAIGKRLPDWAETASRDYGERLRGEVTLHINALAPRSKTSLDEARRLRLEGELLLKAVPDRALIVALDRAGRQWSSEQLAEQLERWRGEHRDVAFLIGGADGLSASCLQAAGQRWSLSALTLPHALARVVVTEQLYRAVCISRGHPYHH